MNFGRSTSESTAGNQEKGYTVHSSAKPAAWWNTDAHLASVATSEEAPSEGTVMEVDGMTRNGAVAVWNA